MTDLLLSHQLWHYQVALKSSWEIIKKNEHSGKYLTTSLFFTTQHSLMSLMGGEKESNENPIRTIEKVIYVLHHSCDATKNVGKYRFTRSHKRAE